MFAIKACRSRCATLFRYFDLPVYNKKFLFRDSVSTLPDKVAIEDVTGKYTFSDIFASSSNLSNEISNKLDGKTAERVLFLCPNDASYVVTVWAIWLAGHIAVPLSPLHPDNLLMYYANDTQSNLMITNHQFEKKMAKLADHTRSKLHVLSEDCLLTNRPTIRDEIPKLNPEKDAIIFYTSGTTGLPKGVVWTYKNLRTQMEVLTEAWKWSQNDTILHTLPLHHVHGTINALFCPLFIGATTAMLPKFDAKIVWSRLLSGQISVFMAVPTIYSKLIEEYESSDLKHDGKLKNDLKKKVRLMVSGSAPLPAPLYDKWLSISGHKLLERYGMTEIGMCLSNLYDSDRKPGFVGLPLDTVTVGLFHEESQEILLTCSNEKGQIWLEPNKLLSDLTGELLVKGDSVFKAYYNKPEETKKEFTRGWFKTGDISQYVVNEKKFRMLGRKSADIIKSGGYKISALQVETVILGHPSVKECAIVGVPDESYGERVGAVIVVKTKNCLDLEQLRNWTSDKMPKYCVPTILKIKESIPKNAMGKVNKKELIKTVF